MISLDLPKLKYIGVNPSTKLRVTQKNIKNTHTHKCQDRPNPSDRHEAAADRSPSAALSYLADEVNEGDNE
jgi:hypothetical protein